MDKEQELLEYLRKIYTEWLNKKGNAMRPETLDEQLALYLINKEHEIAKLKEDKTKILTDIRNYLVAILDEWHRRIDEPNFYEQNIGVYNHIRKELDDLTEYAEKLGVKL